MSDNLLTFEKFTDPALAAAIQEQLQAQGIHSEIDNDNPVFDVSFANNQYQPTTLLKLAPDDFIRARAALDAYYQSQLSGLDPDYYLFSFTDEELLNIVKHPDEWGPLDNALAKQLLARHGRPLTDDQAATFQQERLTTLAKPEKIHRGWIIFGYITALTGGFIGFIMGYLLAYSKKTLPNGERVYIYTPLERRHGKQIVWLSVLCFVIWLLAGFGWMPWIFFWG